MDRLVKFFSILALASGISAPSYSFEKYNLKLVGSLKMNHGKEPLVYNDKMKGQIEKISIFFANKEHLFDHLKIITTSVKSEHESLQFSRTISTKLVIKRMDKEKLVDVGRTDKKKNFTVIEIYSDPQYEKEIQKFLKTLK